MAKLEGLAGFELCNDPLPFENAGFADWVRNRFVELMQHEQSHVSLLESVIGDGAVQPCNYSL